MEDEEKGIVHIFNNYPFTSIDNNIINNPNIDYYTLGVYVTLKWIINNHKNQDILTERGKAEYIEKALNKLTKEGYIEEAD